MPSEIEEKSALPSAFQGQLRTCSDDTGFGATPGFITFVNTLVGLTATGVAAQYMSHVAIQAESTGDISRRTKFRELAEQWRRETALISSIAKASMHPAYQAIIGMGQPALPLIFDEMRNRGGHWLWALRAITQEDPARGTNDLEAAKQAWLAWWSVRQIRVR
jgi:hypothetical protein